MSEKSVRAKRVSNYELFFDLAMVFAIGQLTSAIHLEHVSWLEIFSFIIANITLWVIWINEVFYYEKYGDSRRIDFFSVITLMFFLGNLAFELNMDSRFWLETTGGASYFNWLLIACYCVIIIQYFLKGRHLGFNRDMKVSMGLLGIYILSVLPFALGLFAGNIWVVGIYFLPLILPRIANYYLYRGVKSETNFPHALERSQLVTILTFGEAVIAIISTYPLSSSLYQGALLFFAMAALFMFYMAQTFVGINHHQEANVTPLFYFHVLIFLGVNSFTVGLEFLADHHHVNLGLWFFITGVVLFSIGTLMTSTYNQSIYLLKKKHYLVFGVGILLFIIIGFLIGAHILPLSIHTIIMVTLGSRYYFMIRRHARERNNIPHPDPKLNLRDFS
ncbi:low temperature requirement protein A [Streptococcus suis]|nr:low temperature requirement protein A [Streptococcus suis]